MNKNLSHIVKAYLNCALWLQEENDEFNNFTVSDLCFEGSQAVKLMVTKFLNTIGEKALNEYLKVFNYDQLGYDLYLTQNGHGTGFWDRETISKELKDKLTIAAQSLGETDLYIDDENELNVCCKLEFLS